MTKHTKEKYNKCGKEKSQNGERMNQKENVSIEKTISKLHKRSF